MITVLTFYIFCDEQFRFCFYTFKITSKQFPEDLAWSRSPKTKFLYSCFHFSFLTFSIDLGQRWYVSRLLLIPAYGHTALWAHGAFGLPFRTVLVTISHNFRGSGLPKSNNCVMLFPLIFRAVFRPPPRTPSWSNLC